MKKTVMVLLLLLGLLLCADAAAAADSGVYTAVNSDVAYQYLCSYDVNKLNQIMTTDLKSFATQEITVSYPQAQNAVKLYRVKYKTVVPEKSNKPTEAYGLIALPDTGKSEYPLVSYQHGTVFTRMEVPSIPDSSMETKLMVANFAGSGYIVVAADYIGKGFSAEPDSYMVKESTAQACYDMLMASQAVLQSMHIKTNELFLSGWSQGAWSTMQFLNRLEKVGVHVNASATACTPTDPYTLMARWINVPTELDVQWILGTVSLLICSYEQYYDLPGLSQAAIKPQYWQTVRDFYENKIEWSEVSKVLPLTTKELLQEDFAAQVATVGNGYYRQLLSNQAYHWRFATPTRFYFGKIDEVMPPYMAKLAAEYQPIIGGAATSAVYAGDKADHRGTFMFGIKDQKQWFDSMRK